MFRISRIMQTANRNLCHRANSRALSSSSQTRSKSSSRNPTSESLNKDILQLQNVRIKLDGGKGNGNLEEGKRHISSWISNPECTHKKYNLNTCPYPVSEGNRYNLMSCVKKASLRLGHGSARKKKIARSIIPKQFISAWEGRARIEDCEEQYVPIDTQKYQISDKATRVYQMTWDQGTYIKRKRAVCCGECEERPFHRRPRKYVAPTVKITDDMSDLEKKCRRMQVHQNPATEGLHERLKDFTICNKYKMPFCEPANKSTLSIRLQRARLRKPCQKECTPYPSFTECRLSVPLNKPKFVRECGCLARPALCEMIELIKFREKFNEPATPSDNKAQRPK